MASLKYVDPPLPNSLWPVPYSRLPVPARTGSIDCFLLLPQYKTHFPLTDPYNMSNAYDNPVYDEEEDVFKSDDVTIDITSPQRKVTISTVEEQYVIF